jgi:DNA-binding MarR family transcriptional regulator
MDKKGNNSLANELKISKRELAKIGLSCIQFNLKKTARRISAYYDQVLLPSGLKSTQFSVLIVVASEEARSITGLSRLVDVDRTTLQRSLEVLHRDGLISIEREDKGNIRFVSITGHGKKKLEAAIPLWKAAQDTLDKALGSENIKKLLRVLANTRKINRNPLV